MISTRTPEATYSQAELNAADLFQTAGEVVGTMIDATANQLDAGGKAKVDCERSRC
jgi:hypothetical protein